MVLGIGLFIVGFFLYGDFCGDRFERDIWVLLFGVFVYSCIYDMDV